MVSWRLDMAGKSPVTATDEQKAGLKALGHCADRAGADRARALLVTLDGWTSARIAQAFGVREDTGTALAERFRSGRGRCPEGAHRAGASAV
jgi:hypothetical protein